MRRAALAAVIAMSCVPVGWARGQHPNAPRFARAPGAARPQAGNRQANRQPYQNRPGLQNQGRPGGNQGQRPVPGYSGSGYPNSGNPGSGNPGSVNAGPAYRGAPYASPVRPGYVYPGAAPA